MDYLPSSAEMDLQTPSVSPSFPNIAYLILILVFHSALLNVIETLLNISYVYLAHVSEWPPATLVGFAAATMTLSKTVLYWAQEYYCGFCAVGHNSLSDLVFLWIIPNG